MVRACVRACVSSTHWLMFSRNIDLMMGQCGTDGVLVDDNGMRNGHGPRVVVWQGLSAAPLAWLAGAAIMLRLAVARPKWFAQVCEVHTHVWHLEPVAMTMTRQCKRCAASESCVI